MSVTVTLSLPHRSLSPNARTHWRVKAKAVKEARANAKLETLAAIGRTPIGGRPDWREAVVSIHWFTKTIVHPDRDNALSSLKAAFDGIADSGLLANDRGLYHEPIRFTKDARRPRVEITLTEKAEAKAFLEGLK